jgi:uncharacterized membrane protein
MFDELGALLCLLPIVLLLFSICIVLASIALARTRQIANLMARIERLERRSRSMSATLERLVLSEEPEQPAPEPIEVAPALRQEPLREPTELQWSARDYSWLETWVGRHGLGWAAVILLLFGAAFFIKYAFENHWIGELGRVATGVLAAVAFCAAGFVYHRRGWRVFSQMLSAAGAMLLYLSTFAAFGYYHLLSRELASVYLVVLIIEIAAMALLYNAPSIALLAVIGGLLNPLLLHTEQDQYLTLFVYLILLNAGVVGLAIIRSWRAIGTVALIGTYALFWAWYWEYYHPAKLSAALIFLAVLLGLYLFQVAAVQTVRRRLATIEDLARLPLNALLFSIAAYLLLDEDYHSWLGSLALALAVVHAGLAWLVFRRFADDERVVLVLVAISVGFVTAVFPLQADAAWIAPCWAMEGFLLWWFGLRIRSVPLRGMSVVLLSIGVLRLVAIDAPEAHPVPFIPLFNKFGLPAAAVALCTFGVVVVSRRLRPSRTREELWPVWVAGLAAVGIVWLLLTIETYDYFVVLAESRLREVQGANARQLLDVSGHALLEQRLQEQEQARRTAQTALSVVWAGFAGILLAIGLIRRLSFLRWTALFIFAVTLAKVFLIDMASLPGFYRVVAFLVLSIVMGAAAWGYNKMRFTRRGPEEERTHEMP